MTLRKPARPLCDGVVELRPLGPGHEPGFAQLVADAGVQRFTRVPAPAPAGYAGTWLGRYVQGWEEGALAGFAIHDAASGEFAGFAGVVRYDPQGRQGELGYAVLPAHRGRGMAGRALALLTDWALRDVGLERVELLIGVGNPASERIAARCGYVREGVLRSLHLKGGVREDTAVWSRLPGD